MSSDVRDKPLAQFSAAGDGPLRYFRVGRRAVLRSLATGVGAAAVALPALTASSDAPHDHAPAPAADSAALQRGASGLVFFDPHAFETLGLLGEQIVPGSRAARVPEFLDRLLDVESTDTQGRFMQALGAFEREARTAYDKPWKALTAAQATALLERLCVLPEGDSTRAAFDRIKGAVAETYFSSEPGKKELGWQGTVVHAPPSVCA